MIYLHRANSLSEIERTNAAGWGIEVDVRTVEGELVLTHDAPAGKGNIDFALFKDAVRAAKFEMLVDFKESGIVRNVVNAIRDVGKPLDQFIAIDLIVPDMLTAESMGMRTLARKSGYERIEGPFWGYWVDYALSCADLEAASANSVLVSPELHGKPLTPEYIARAKTCGLIGVCTDQPEEWT
jgi:hypothetical protein